MKKYYLILIIVLVGLSFASAQRMIPKQKGIEFTMSILSNAKIGQDYALNLGMTINGKNGNYQLWALEYSHRYYPYKNSQIPQETYTAEGDYSFFLFGDAQKNIALNFALTAVVGYETINRGETQLLDGAQILSEDQFIYGAGGRVSFETYLTDQFVFLLQGRTKMIWGTDLEQFRPSIGLGIRYNF